MPKVIISDTSCLILLGKIGELGILRRTFGQVTVTPVVATEYRRPLPDWISVSAPKLLDGELYEVLDAGEASSIALAIEQEDALLIIDEYKGRHYAKAQGLKITGTLGVLAIAKEIGVIGSVKPLIDRIATTNFRLSPRLVSAFLKQMGEA